MMNLESKKIDLYKEFRAYSNLSEEDKLEYKAKLKNDAAKRSESEKTEYKAAILSNVQEIREKLTAINVQIDKQILVHA
jgi:hypothetical protein